MMKLLVAFFLAAITFPSAVFGDIVVDNYSEAGGGGYGLRVSFFGQSSATIAQQFNTGGDTLQLGTISVNIIRDTATTDFTARLWNSSSNNLPDVAISNLSLINSPQPNTEDTYVFKPDSAVFLDGQTDYFFSIENNIGANSLLAGSVFNSNQYIGDGNILERVARSDNSGSTWTAAGTNAILISVTSVPEASGLGLIAFLASAMLAWRRMRSECSESLP